MRKLYYKSTRIIAFILVLTMFLSLPTFAVTTPTTEAKPIAAEWLIESLELDLAADEIEETKAEEEKEEKDFEELAELTEEEEEEASFVYTGPPAPNAVAAGDVRIQNNSLRIDIGRLGQINRMNIVDMQFNRNNAEFNFVGGQHNFGTQQTNSATHQWFGEMIFSTRSAPTVEGLAAQRFVEVDTNRTMQAGGRATNSSPGGDPNVNPFFNRTVSTDGTRAHITFNPDRLPTGGENNPSGGDLNTATFGVGATLWLPAGSTSPTNRERIITNFQVDSIFDANTDDGSILWTIEITNRSDEYIEFGDIGLPMTWNNRYSSSNDVYDNRVGVHTYQGVDSGYVKAIPASGSHGAFMLFTPVPQSGARIEYIEHWNRNQHGAAGYMRSGASFSPFSVDAGGQYFPGLSVAYIHSANIRNLTGQSYFHDTDFYGNGRTPLYTSLILAPGESESYQFKFHAVRGGDNEPSSQRVGRNTRQVFDDLEVNHMLEQEMNMRSVLHDMGMIDAVAVPGFQTAIDMPTLLALRYDKEQVDINEVRIYCIHENDVFGPEIIPPHPNSAIGRSRVSNARGGRGLHNHPDNAEYTKSVKLREDLSGYHDGEWVEIYELTFGCIGNASVRVYYDLIDEDDEAIRPAFTQFEFNILTELDELTRAHADFLRTNQQFSTVNRFNFTGDDAALQAHQLYGVYADWYLHNQRPSRISGANSNIFTNETTTTAWGDDWSHGHALFMAKANYMNPSYDNIRSLETYLIDFMWERYMKSRQHNYVVQQWLATDPWGGQGNASSIISDNTGTGRGRMFNTIMVANAFYNMYLVQRAFPEFMEYREDALFYLDIGAAILDQGFNFASYSGNTGVYGEQQIESMIQALHEEGRIARRNSLRTIYMDRGNSALNIEWPFGSEFEYDNTGEEGMMSRTLVLMRHDPNHPRITGVGSGNVNGQNRALRLMQLSNWTTRAKRGWQPNWFQYAVPVFRGGESWWNFQYTASLAGSIMDRWIRYQYDYHNWNLEDIAWANRVNYAAKVSNFGHVNMGQMSDRSIGGVAVTYTLSKGNTGTMSVNGNSSAALSIQSNGWHNWGMEAPLAVYGSLLSVSTDVVTDPIFGPFAYGGKLTRADDAVLEVQTRDGFGRRLNFLEEKVYVTSDNNKIEEARFTRDGSRLELDMANIMGVPHVARIGTYGLTPGYYSVTLNGAPAGQFYVTPVNRRAPNSPGSGFGARAKEATAFVAVPNGDDFTLVFERITGGEAAAASVKFVPQFAEPTEKTPFALSGQVLHDGFRQIQNYKWEVTSAPAGSEVSFNGRVTGGGTAANGNTAIVDTSLIRVATMTASDPGDYVVRLTVTFEDGSTAYGEQAITVVAGEFDSNLAPEIFNVQTTETAAGFRLQADVRNNATGTGISRANVATYEWNVVAWPAGAYDDIELTIPNNATSHVSEAIGRPGRFARTHAVVNLPVGGTYVVRLTARHNNNFTYEYFTVVAGDNEPPTEVDTTLLWQLHEVVRQYNTSRSWVGTNRNIFANAITTEAGTAGGTGRFTNWAASGIAAARDAAEAVLANPTSQEQVDEAFENLRRAVLWLQPVAAVLPNQTGNLPAQRNIAFLAGRGASHVTGDTRVWNINNNAAASTSAGSNWGSWNTGGIDHPLGNRTDLPASGSTTQTWNFLEYHWPTGARIYRSDVVHWRDGSGINTPTAMSYMYLPLDSDVWVEAWAVGQAGVNAPNPNSNTTTSTTFSEPIEARALQVWVRRLANGNAPGINQWQVFGELLDTQDAPAGPFTVTHLPDAAATSGAISGVTDAMEWSISANGPWTAIAEDATAITGLGLGDYYIRYASVAGLLPSPATLVSVRVARADVPTGLGTTPAHGHLADGTITGVTVAMEWSASVNGPWTSVTGNTVTRLTAGVYFVRFAQTDVLAASDAVSVTVGTGELNQTARTDVPTGLAPVAPSARGVADGQITGVTEAMEWSDSEDGSWIRVTGDVISGLGAGTYYVRFAETANFFASGAVAVVVPDGPKGSQAAPIGLVGRPVSAFGVADGRIFGVSTPMEWAASPNGPWTPVTGNVISDLGGGTYYIRRAETEAFYASPAVAVLVQSPIGSLRINASIIETVARGHTYNFGVVLNPGAIANGIVWTISNPALASVDSSGNVRIFERTGTVVLLATDPVSGISNSVMLRIAS